MTEPNPFANIEAIQPFLGAINAFRNGLAEAQVSPDFRDQITADFVRMMCQAAVVGQVKAVLDEHPTIASGATLSSWREWSPCTRGTRSE